MKTLTKYQGVSSLACAVALFGTGANLFADTIEFGNPPDPGNGNFFPFTGNGFNINNRYQQVYNSSFFAGAGYIDTITFYNTQLPGAVFETADYTIRLSTTTKPVNGLDFNMNNNVGGDEAVFYAATLSGLTGVSFTFDGSDFYYDPSLGNLLVDIQRVNQIVNSGSGFLDARNGTFGTDSSRMHNYDSGFESFGLRTTFETKGTSVPDAGPTFALLGFALLGLGAVRRQLAQ
ncbi:MAG TPA: VPDSG-CTERM sorting domain-containing protein [Verrucomicrobiota bacterium]|nr:hypothetical protein [Verrucomicrobiales bacterium]HRI14730.1 VPDSG-CTERM sorting domain-containing protein [Verrucomicrobiota bacterium]